MTLYEIDHDATRRRVEAVTADGLRALSELRQRSEDLDKTTDEMFERQEREKQAMDEQVTAAKEKEQPAAEARPKPKRTLSLGGEEFQQAREARQADAAGSGQPKPAAEPQSAAEPQPQGPNQTLKQGAQEDREPERDKPVRKRPPRPEADDDMSGRTWLR